MNLRIFHFEWVVSDLAVLRLLSIWNSMQLPSLIKNMQIPDAELCKEFLSIMHYI